MTKNAERAAANGAEPPTSQFPTYLLERFRAWRATKYQADRSWYAQLSDNGQRPRAMIIACCDSRVDVQALLGAEPGELFMVRNVANLCPPFAPDHEHHGTSAAIEYAVTALKVAHIVVLGHAQCGGVAAYHDRADAIAAGKGSTSFVDRWMDILRPAYQRLEAGERAERVRALEQEGVKTSLRNLAGFPFVRDAIDSGRLTLHGGWFDISEGQLHVLEPETGLFQPV